MNNDIEQQLAHYRSQAVWGLGIGIFGAVIAVISLVTFTMPFAVIGVILIFAGVMLYSRAASKIKENIGVAVAKKVMDRIFDHYEYFPQDHISSSIIENTPIPYLGYYEDIEGNDYIRGQYQGMNFEMSDIHLSRTETTTDSDGHTTTTEVTVFDGLWFICDFAKQIRSRITVSPKPLLSFSKGIQTESTAFNRKFYVESRNDHDAFYVLTPQMMEKMLQTQQEMNCEFYFVFEQDGVVQILVNKGNSLEVSALSRSVSKIEEQFERELGEVTNLIDELKLTDAYR